MHPAAWATAAFRRIRGIVRMLDEARRGKGRTNALRDLIVRELRANADLVRQHQTEHLAIQTVREQLRTAQWERHAPDIAVLWHGNRDLLKEVGDAYEGFILTRERGIAPPDGVYLTDLARRFEEAEI
jgi:hypothetical protein